MRRAPLALLLAGGVPLVLAADAPKATGPNPHGHASCDTCHLVREPPPGDWSAGTWQTGSPETACTICHDYRHHQSGLLPTQTVTPEGWPMPAGRVGCITCHDPHPDPIGAPVTRWMLRGGPYQRIGIYCGACHSPEAVKAATARDPSIAPGDTTARPEAAGEAGSRFFNPHEAIDPVKDAAVCAHCHLEGNSPQDVRVLSMTICIGCHTEDEHAGSREHLGRVPPPMREGARQARLPVTEDGTMGCVTCHDPHPAGVLARTRIRENWLGKPAFPEEWTRDVLAPTLARRAEEMGLTGARLSSEEPDFLWLPVRNGLLCSTCHGAGDPVPDRSHR